MPTTELLTDVALGVAMPSRNARGRIARLGPVVDSILHSHEYPPILENLLAEALTLTALLGSLLKEPQGQLTLQAQTEGGIIDLLVCDYLGGELRGYVRHDPERLQNASAEPTLQELFGKGYLAITFDQPVSDERYQGIVPLEGKNLAEAAQSYFAQSEQIRASSGSRPRSAASIGSRAVSCCSTCPRARRGASGCTRGSTILTGRTWRSSADR
jgi:molecular chaperone Hsp33